MAAHRLGELGRASLVRPPGRPAGDGTGLMKRLLVAAALLFTACAGPRNSLNTPASTCFRGLPAAAAAVGGKAELVGVRRVPTHDLVDKVLQAGRVPPGEVCLVAYRGPFAGGEVAGADPAGPGTYAVVALDDRGSRVLATFVLDQLPVRFRHKI